MKKRIFKSLVLSLSALTLMSGCSLGIKPIRKGQIDNRLNVEAKKPQTKIKTKNDATKATQIASDDKDKKKILSKFENIEPGIFSSYVNGVKLQIHNVGKEVALTFDAENDGFDEAVYRYLKDNNIKATIFATKSWLEEHDEVARKIVEDGLVKISNHGSRNLSYSVSKFGQQDMETTKSVEELYDEVIEGQLYIEKLTKEKTPFARSLNSYYDEGSIKVLKSLDITPCGYAINVDGKGMNSPEKALKLAEKTQEGDILKFSIDNPDGNSLDCLKKVDSMLKANGYQYSYLK